MLASRWGARAFLARSTTATRMIRPLQATTTPQWFHSTPCRFKEEEKAKETTTPKIDIKDQNTAITGRQRIVVAVGGNALQRRGERLTIEK